MKLDSEKKVNNFARSSIIIMVSCAIVVFAAFVSQFPFVRHDSSSSNEYKVVGYITPWNWRGLPDPTKFTHIIYCFADIDTQTHKISLTNSKYLEELIALKEENPNLKIMVSLGGGGADGFSQAAETEQSREIFAEECLGLIDKYKIDGVDIDWESPVNGGWGSIRSIPEDKENCTKLVAKIRNVIGENKIISFATASTNSYANWVELNKLNKYVNFFNLMSYCYSVGADGCHDANLYDSSYAAMGGISVEFGVNMLIKNGVDKNKIVIGIPFFAYDDGKAIKQSSLAGRIESGNYVQMWDDDAKAPYLTLPNSSKIKITFDNPDSIKYKAEFVRKNGFGGIMCWEIGHDDDKYTMLNAVWDSLKAK